MADGLSHSTVQCIGQDKHGFIWVGTKNGLNIYDGIRFKHLVPVLSDEKSLPGNNITELVFEGDSVWVATRSGLCKMDVKTKSCKRFDLGENIDIRAIFLEHNNNTLWVGTVSGLLKLNTITGQYREFNTSSSNISNNTIRAIYKDSEQNLWVGTYDKLNLLKPQSEVFKHINLKTAQQTNIKYNLVLSICPYAANNDSLLWVGTETGLVLYNQNSEEMKFFQN
jgi:ligand-binding sensor domain-containing protein